MLRPRQEWLRSDILIICAPQPDRGLQVCLFHLFQEEPSHGGVIALYQRPLGAILASLLLLFPSRTLSSEGEPETFLKQIFFSKSEASSVNCYLRITLKEPHRNLKSFTGV